MIQIEPTPNPESLKFLTDKIVSSTGTEEFQKSNIIKIENIFVKELLNIKGIELVLLSKNFISIGKELSFNLNLNIGDKIMLMSPSGIETIIGSLPKQEIFIVDSIFDSGLDDFDQNNRSASRAGPRPSYQSRGRRASRVTQLPPR